MRPKARMIFFNKYKMLKAKKFNNPFASNCAFNTLLKQKKTSHFVHDLRPLHLSIRVAQPIRLQYLHQYMILGKTY